VPKHEENDRMLTGDRRLSRRRAAAMLVAGLAATAAIAGCSPGAASTAVPVLGRPAGLFAHGTGWGKVRPTEIFNGGDPTGLVTHIRWSAWGNGSITGKGMSYWPHPSVAAGKEEPVEIVAFNLGTCDGKLMYQAVEWFFPEHGEAFKANQYENVCTGTYVGQ
jgi:hypothetical protein